MGKPEEIWGNYSLRQIIGFYRIYCKKKFEEMRFTAALHGAEIKDDGNEGGAGRRIGRGKAITVSGRTEDNNKTVNIDLTVATPEEWSMARGMLGGGGFTR